ncbi:FAD-dependent oxidoreductase [Natronosporangium hydrolyticum]|uniref:FAD-dependent oxidoreductase n=1 Tax=Natronosporangium hydrolyticum TaxID=2811111 RepID=A0A895YFL7_9ACTN|nr:FAD-dependent oxidoreductase [Natronosporangium hydrolyticum]QSB16664.1 FAD-dependent oxidoreductase [Natronosporangium hydrolyticum]
MMMQITVVGGGLGGLVAAVCAAESGARVTLFEAHASPGGRARSTPAPYIANDGPHVFYSDGPHWRWLSERGLVPAAGVGLAEARGLRFRRDGALRRLPSAGVLAASARRGVRAPAALSFTEWATGRFGARTARQIASMMGVATFDADPGRLSAAFVWERFLRVTRPGYPAARYVRGGWQTVVDRLTALARQLGVEIHTGVRVGELPPPPVIVATSLAAARGLLGDPTLATASGRTVLLDLGLRRRRGDAFLVFDQDQAGFLERYSSPDPSLAPAGESLAQAQLPLRPGESKAQGLTRLAPLLELALPGWQERTTWRRASVADGRSGALDLPGHTWRDRPAVDRGDRVYLVGDQVAAPGLLSEVTLASARRAAALAVGVAAQRRTMQR